MEYWLSSIDQRHSTLFESLADIQFTRITMKISALALTATLGIALAPAGQAAVKSIVLVHGAFADGSGWKAVVDILERDGYSVYVAQIPETTFEADVAATKLILDRSGPCVLVGHSYGGIVITEAGVHASVKSAARRDPQSPGQALKSRL